MLKAASVRNARQASVRALSLSPSSVLHELHQYSWTNTRILSSGVKVRCHNIGVLFCQKRMTVCAGKSETCRNNTIVCLNKDLTHIKALSPQFDIMRANDISWSFITKNVPWKSTSNVFYIYAFGRRFLSFDVEFHEFTGNRGCDWNFYSYFELELHYRWCIENAFKINYINQIFNLITLNLINM